MSSTTTKTTISTPLPASLSASTLLTTLHAHDSVISALCPSLISRALLSGDENTTATYSITDKRPIGQTTYKLTLTNTPTGLDTLVCATTPGGALRIQGAWRIEDGHLVEEVAIEGNFLVRKMARGNVDRTHPEQHRTLLGLCGA